jgi:hypothetical protein
LQLQISHATKGQNVSNTNTQSGSASPTPRDFSKAWVRPFIAALIVTALLIVERLQVDWSADCSLSGGSACDTDAFANVFAWLPVALTYAVFHIWGARHFTERTSPLKIGLKRSAGIAVYTALQLLPVPGWYLWFAGIAGGFIISLTVIGLVVAPAVGAMTAGFCAGLILAAFAGPPLKGMTGKQLKPFFWNYGLGGGIGALILAVGQVIFDPAFAYLAGPENPWLTATGALATILAVGVVMSYFGERAWRRAGLVESEQSLQLKHLGWAAALAALLIVPSHFMVKNNVTVFGKNGERFPLVAQVLRGNKPAIDTPFLLGGLNYVGRREDVERREIIQRSRMEHTVHNKGTASEVTESKTVYDGLTQWRLTDKTSAPGEAIYVTADRSAQMIEQECLPDVSVGDTFCVRSDAVERDNLKKTFAIAVEEDGFLLSEKVPEALLGVRIAAQTPDVRDKKTWKLTYCRLNLVNVTAAKFSAHQVIPCTADWVSTARALRRRLEGDFAAIQSKP